MQLRKQYSHLKDILNLATHANQTRSTLMPTPSYPDPQTHKHTEAYNSNWDKLPQVFPCSCPFPTCSCLR